MSLSRIRWTTVATADLESIAEYLIEKTLLNAPQLIRKIYQAPSSLQNYPQLGRAGKKEGTRELVVSPLPYVVFYTVTDEAIYIVRVLQGAQDWPI